MEASSASPENAMENTFPPPVMHALILFGFLLLTSFAAPLQKWPSPLLVPIFGSSIAVYAAPSLRYRAHWLRFGAADGVLSGIAVATFLLAPALILAWSRLASPDLSALSNQIPAGSLLALVFYGIAFAFINAASEEIIFRGVLQEALTARLGAKTGWIAQGAIFGALHANGVPQGAAGMLMASAFGIVLGWMRERSGGVGLCCVVHFATDATIFALLATMRGG